MGPEQVLIVGAGFSRYAGLPLQSGFTKELLRAADFKKGPSKRVVDFLNKFVGRAFNGESNQWPELEDLFTCFDLSANTGHHLGLKHDPSFLRTVRRALISRMIRRLWKSYEDARKKPGTDWNKLDSLLRRIDLKTTAFLSLNWDTVIEQRMMEINGSLHP